MIIKKVLGYLILGSFIFVNNISVANAIDNMSNHHIFTVALDPSFTQVQNIMAGSGNVKLAQYTLTATSSVKINTIGLSVRQDQSNFSRISNLRMMIGQATLGQTIIDPIALTFNDSVDRPNNINTSLAFEAGETKVIDVYGDINLTPVSGSKFQIKFGGMGIISENRINLFSPSQEPIYTIITPDCKADTNGNLILISPNGNEVYYEGQTITMKWSTCNIPSDSYVLSYLETYNDNNDLIGHVALAPTVNNSGSESFILRIPEGSKPGKHFRVKVDVSDGVTTLVNSPDFSDNSFTINKLPPFTRTLRIGMRGDDVKALQSLLGIKADGVYGRGTAGKVKLWQVEHGLPADGAFGAKSQAKLFPTPPVTSNQ